MADDFVQPVEQMFPGQRALKLYSAPGKLTVSPLVGVQIFENWKKEEVVAGAAGKAPI